VNGLFSRVSLVGVGGAIQPLVPMKRRPSVSVVVPCYNYGRYLPKCVASLTAQADVDVEVIIVDDCSTDDSLATARALAEMDSRVRVIVHPVNKGHITTYNDGLAAAEGEFVLLLSADDLVTPGALGRGAALLLANETVGMVYGNAIHFYGEPPVPRTDPSHWIVWKGGEWLSARCRSGYNVVASPEVMMRTSTLRSIGYYRHDLPHAGDFEMWLRTSAVSDVGFIVGADQAFYRHHDANMNTSQFSSGTDEGRFVDLEQRMASFTAVFNGVGRNLSNGEQLFTAARRTMASQALNMANYAYARGHREFPYARFVEFARDQYPQAHRLPAGRAYARRHKVGMWPQMPLHPLWAPSAIAWRMQEYLRRWRRYRVGV
jgi:glycosyltransferase involved in cell wall biosynthesis